MPVLRVNDRQHALKPGRTRLGGGAGVDVSISDDERLGLVAVVDTSGSQAVIHRTGNAVVKVNGVALGAEPTPLMHGDKVEVAGRELFFADDAKAGSTQVVTQNDVTDLVKKRAGARATVGTGGRLVSLVDGKEYLVPARGITIGRDAASDVVVAQNEVSRRHAEIVPSERGYLLHDYSTNGVYVNGNRVQQSQLLSRADIVRIGTEEFRFYADVVAPAAPAAATATPTPEARTPAPASAAPPAAAAESTASLGSRSPADAVPAVSRAPSVAPASSAETTHQVPAVTDAAVTGSGALPDPRPVLAVLEVLSERGEKAIQYEIRVPLAHVGRGAFNDVSIDDDSVSETHAKLQRRDDGWYLIDLASTNGTYVGGSRVVNERRLDGMPEVRIGGVTMRFRSTDVPVASTKGTRAIPNVSVDRGRVAPSPSREPKTAASAAAARRRSEPQRPKSSGSSAWLWILILLAAAAAAAFYLLKS